MESKCCSAKMYVVNGREGTSYYACYKCDRPCDPKSTKEDI